jgi:hypothetical protein
MRHSRGRGGTHIAHKFVVLGVAASSKGDVGHDVLGKNLVRLDDNQRNAGGRHGELDVLHVHHWWVCAERNAPTREMSGCESLLHVTSIASLVGLHGTQIDCVSRCAHARRLPSTWGAQECVRACVPACACVRARVRVRV